jgi:hypothetical protein
MSSSPSDRADRARPALIRPTPLQGDDEGIDLRRLLPAWLISGVLHVVVLSVFLLVGMGRTESAVGTEPVFYAGDVTDNASEKNLLVDDLGDDPSLPSGFNNQRQEEFNIPGPASFNEALGILNGQANAAPSNIPPPPGWGNGSGNSLTDPNRPGTGIMQGKDAGYSLPVGKFVPGGMAGRSGSTKDKLLDRFGGNQRSEAAVAAGLKWLIRHQALEGRWGMHDFHVHGRCNCAGQGGNHDVAGTGLAILALQGAGQTHRGTGANNLYMKNVERGLAWLLNRQGVDGSFSGNGYEHAIAAIAVCEAYGLTAEPNLKGPAQRAINCCVAWQHTNGGFRYSPRTPGDLSVGGWFVQALKSGHMAGLHVPNVTWDNVNFHLDSVSTPDGAGYGYTGPQPAPTMTAVGLLSRQYMGWGPKNLGLEKGSQYLLKLPPSKNFRNIYYYYYATQVMFHLAPANPDGWNQWNDKMRDLLIDTQDQGFNPDKRDQKGSWSADGDAWGGQLGRHGYTCLALLTLEVYYRHLPLYRRELGQLKPDAVRARE